MEYVRMLKIQVIYINQTDSKSFKDIPFLFFWINEWFIYYINIHETLMTINSNEKKK